MQLTSLLAAALLPLVALAQDPTTASATSTVTLTKTVRIAKIVATTTKVFNSTSSYMPTGTGSSTIVTVLPSTANSSTTAGSATAGSEPSTTSLLPVVGPTIKNGGATLGAAHVALVGVAGVVVAALM